MIGTDDFMQSFKEEVRMPFGLDKIMNTLMKQVEKQFSEVEGAGVPRGFKIQISTGKPKIEKVAPRQERMEGVFISQEESERRKSLPKEDAKSKIRRVGDSIIYEIFAPGIKSEKDIVITKLEESIELKAYSKDKCYCKTIPLKVEIIGYTVSNDKVFLELKG